MRIQFPDIGRPKKAAKFLSRAEAGSKLSQVQEALARELGYRDWHDLAGNVRQDSPEVRIPMKPDGYSDAKPDRHSNLMPDTVPI